jgi:hypothetical protein
MEGVDFNALLANGGVPAALVVVAWFLKSAVSIGAKTYSAYVQYTEKTIAALDKISDSVKNQEATQEKTSQQMCSKLDDLSQKINYNFILTGAQSKNPPNVPI